MQLSGSPCLRLLSLPSSPSFLPVMQAHQTRQTSAQVLLEAVAWVLGRSHPGSPPNSLRLIYQRAPRADRLGWAGLMEGAPLRWVQLPLTGHVSNIMVRKVIAELGCPLWWKPGVQGQGLTPYHIGICQLDCDGAGHHGQLPPAPLRY